MHYRSLSIIIVIYFITFSVMIPDALAATIEINKTGTVSSVLDGSSFMLTSGETVKLALIDTPAAGETGYSESKTYLSGLLPPGTTVYLDIDTITRTDQGRLLCVVYINYNATYYENINQAMLQNNYATPSIDNNTKFNRASWTWFVSKQEPTVSPTTVATSTLTATPTPTPFSAPSPSVNPSVPELPTTIALIIVGTTTLLIIAQTYTKKRNKK